MKKIICLHPEVRDELSRNLVLYVLWEREYGGYDTHIIMSETYKAQVKKREVALLKELKTRVSVLEKKHKQIKAA